MGVSAFIYVSAERGRVSTSTGSNIHQGYGHTSEETGIGNHFEHLRIKLPQDQSENDCGMASFSPKKQVHGE